MTPSVLFEQARTSAARVPYVRRLAWRSGRLVHHTYPMVRRRLDSSPEHAPTHESDTTTLTDAGAAAMYPRPTATTEPLPLEPAPASPNPVLTAADGAVDYADRECLDAPLLEGTDERFGWNSGAMHHVDPWYTGEGWRCAVDGTVGFGRSLLSDQHWAIGMYVSTPE